MTTPPALRALALALALALPGLSRAQASTAAPAGLRPLPGIEAELKTPDGWTIKGTYLPARPGAMTLVLLHGAGMRRQAWRLLARHLQRAGFGYLALDLRGHGESNVGPDGKPATWRKFRVTKTQNDFADMALDIQAAYAYLAAQGVGEEKAGIVGADVGGSLGLKYAAVHPKVPLVVLVSPGMAYQEILTVNAMRAYGPRPILMIYSELERNSAKATPLLYEFAKRSAGERDVTLISVADKRGIRMVDGAMAQNLIAWLRAPVKPEVVAGATETMVSTGAFTAAPSTSAVLDDDADEPPIPDDGR